MAYRWKTNLTGTLPDGHTPDLTITLAYDLVDSIDFDVLASSEGDFDFDFDVSRSELARWLLSLGWSEVELPDFLSGADTSELSSVLVYGGQ